MEIKPTALETAIFILGENLGRKNPKKPSILIKRMVMKNSIEYFKK